MLIGAHVLDAFTSKDLVCILVYQLKGVLLLFPVVVECKEFVWSKTAEGDKWYVTGCDEICSSVVNKVVLYYWTY